MKRKLQILAFAAIAVATLASCAKEQFKENVIPAGEKIQVSITGQIGDFTPADATKANAESVVRVTWAANDKVFVYDGSALLGTLTVTPDENNASYALLSGEITDSTAETAPTKLTLVYVKGAETAPAIAGGKVSVDLSTQNQSEVPFVLYSTIDYDANKLTKNSDYVPFSFATSVMTVNCTNLPVGAANAKIGITKAEIEGVSTICELTVTGTGVTIAGANKGTITRTETSEPPVFTQSDSRGSFRLALAADPEAPAARNILVFQGDKVSGAPFTTTKLEENCSYNTVYQMGEYISNEPDGKLSGGFTVDAQGKKVYFSKGNLYAKKDNGTWTWHIYDNQYGYNSLNSQCEDGSRAATEGDTEIDLFTWGYNAVNSINPIYVDYEIGEVQQLSKSDDWGYVFGGESSAWRTLSIAEWRYLFAWTSSGVNTDTESPRYNHYKYGVTVCDKTNCVVLLPDNWDSDIISLSDFANKSEYNGESDPTWEEMEEGGAVCLPAAGSRNGSNVSYVGTYGSYWSSSGSDEDAACYVSIGDWQSDDVNPNKIGSRISGFSVRLVTESSNGYSPAVKVTGVTLGKTETSIGEGSSEILAATVIPANASNKQINWLSSNTSVATVGATSGEVTGVAPGSAVITATTADGNFTAVCLVTVTEPYVIIGGLIWASKNLGATTVAGSYSTCYGDLYQCGSINTLYTGFPWTSATKGSFTFKEGIENGFYFGNAELGEDYMYGEEGSAELPSDNDVVMKKVGNGWRMPTKEDFSALCEACGGDGESNEVNYNTTTDPSGANATVGKGVYACTNYDGVAGCLFVDENGNKLFFPAAGYGLVTDLYDAGFVGRYWSKTLNWSLKSMANCFEFDTNEHVKIGEGASDYERSYGYSIRPVKDINK